MCNHLAPPGSWNENVGRILAMLREIFGSDVRLPADDMPDDVLLAACLERIWQARVAAHSLGNLTNALARGTLFFPRFPAWICRFLLSGIALCRGGWPLVAPEERLPPGMMAGLMSRCPETLYQAAIICLVLGRLRPGMRALPESVRQGASQEACSLAEYILRDVSLNPAPFWHRGKHIAVLRDMQRQNAFEAARDTALRLLASGHGSPILWLILAQLAACRFHCLSAFYMCTLAAQSYPRWRNGLFFIAGAEYALLVRKSADAILALVEHCFRMPYNACTLPLALADSLSRIFGPLPWQPALDLVRSRQNAGLLARLRGVVASLRWRRKQKNGPGDVYGLLGSLGEERACLLLTKRMGRREGRAYTPALLCSLMCGNRPWARTIMAKAATAGIALSPWYVWMALCGLGEWRKAFEENGRAPYFHILDAHLGKRMMQTLPVSREVHSLIIASECFVGDEIRFARLYPALAEKAGAERLSFTCDPRLTALLRRSFPKLDFFPTKRFQQLADIPCIEEFSALPDAACCRYCDNRGWQKMLEADGVISVMHALPSILDEYSGMETLPVLQADPFLQAAFAAKLAPYRKRKLVGLAWAGDGKDGKRDWNFLRLSELEELFTLEGVCFVDCQYIRKTEEEQAYIAGRLRDTFISFPDLNQREDIEGTAALYSCLDAMVTAPTYTGELAASLGLPTILFSPHCIPGMFTFRNTPHHAFMGKDSYIVCVKPSERHLLPAKVKQKIFELLS